MTESAITLEPHPVSDEQQERMTAIRLAYFNLEQEVLRLCPPSRRRSIAITDLEGSAMFAIKSISFDSNGEDD